MRLIFVRHGEPDYERDCLTDTGHRQAAAAAERLRDEGIVKIFSSPMGRARQTAQYTADLLHLPVTVLPYMHEISWGGSDIPDNGHPWTLSERMIDREDFDFSRRDWQTHPYFQNNVSNQFLEMISARSDELLLNLGYRRDGARYLCLTDRDETVAMFSHGGSGACAMSHLMNIPFPYMCTAMPYDFTSVIILNFPVRKGEHVHPRIELFNDCAHIKGTSDGPRFQEKSE